MPIQVKRLLIVFGLFIGLMLALKFLLTPDSWREFNGPYRGEAVREIADKQPKYVQMETCVMCHDDIGELKSSGKHKSLQCELCHGVGYAHMDEPEENPMIIPEGRGYCVTCHEKNPARPANVIKQIDPKEHNIEEECITCHNPHEPWL